MWGWLLKRKLLLSNTLKYLYYVRAVRVSLSTANPPDLMTFHLPKFTFLREMEWEKERATLPASLKL